MALITRKEFATLCGTTPAKLNVYIQRNKVLTDANDKSFIDPANPINVAFKTKQLAGQIKNGKPSPSSKPTPAKKKFDNAMQVLEQAAEPVAKVKKHSGPKTLQERLRDASNPESKVDMEFAAAMEKIRIDNKKEEMALRLQELKIQSEEIKINKLAGNLIDVDLIRGVLKRHADAIFKTFDKGIEQIIEVAVGGDHERRVKVTGQAKRILANCIKDAGEKAKQDISVLVSEFSDQRGRGEKA